LSASGRASPGAPRQPVRARCCPDSCCWNRRNGSCHKILESLYRVLRALFELGQQRGEIRRDTDAMQLAELLIAI
jgi:hypothetical protein